MSIGDSALDYYNEKIIYEKKAFPYPSKKYFQITFYNDPNFKIYDEVQIIILKGDKNYIIEVLNELDIKFVDIENFLYDHKYGNILALTEQHFNKIGYLLVSNIIHEELKKIFVK